MMEKLTCADARQMDLVQYLATLGFLPQKVRGAEYWYLSPLRTERTASFKVDRRLNLWYDHGTGQGGTLIDFGLLYYRCTVGELLRRLGQDHPYARPFPFPQPAPSQARGAQQKEEGKIKITSVGAISSEMLRQYLSQRGVDPALASRYCKEVRFTLYGKAHFALGFPNQSGGYELRNAYFKGSSAPKDITFLDQGRGTVSVFEGFFSFLSYLQLGGERASCPSNFLILNSLALMGRATALVDGHRRVHLYLDRDAAGVQATRKALEAVRHCQDKSGLYRHHKDLNEFLVQGGRRRNRALRPGR